MPFDPDTAIGGGAGRFPPTRRTILAALRSDDEGERTRAFETVVALYWKPLYKYLRLRWNKSNEDAKDLVQGFLTDALEKRAFDGYDHKKGTFRTYLRTLFDRWAANQTKAAAAIKRGGGERMLDFDEAEAEIERQQHQPALPADEYLHREWVRSLVAMALDRLRAASAAEGKELQFRVFELYDVERSEGERLSYAELAARLGIAETSVTNHLAAMRRRFHQLALDTLREVTATEEEFRSEARALLGRES